MRQPPFAFAALALIAALAAPARAAETYSVDAAHSYVGFSVSHMVISKTKGHFNEFGGTLVYDERDLTKCSIKGTVSVASIDTGNPKRDDHLRGADFFDAAKFPQITFESKKVEKRASGPVVTGILTIKGIARPIEIPFKVLGKVKDPWGNERLGVELSPVVINRQEFGLTWSAKLDTGGLVVGDEVTLELAGEFVREAPAAAPAP
jgi:polyisoprenoid-binding protein YceI